MDTDRDVRREMRDPLPKERGDARGGKNARRSENLSTGTGSAGAVKLGNSRKSQSKAYLRKGFPCSSKG